MLRDFSLFLAKIWLTCLINLQWEMFSVISNHISAVSRRNAFIAIKLIVPLSLVYDSVTDEFTDSTNPISKPNSAWICHIQLKLWPFCDILPILAKTWLSWKPPLDPCNQRCLLWGRPQKPSAISNHVLAISCRNALYAFIATLIPKLLAMVKPLCLLCTGVSQSNSLMV